jgi:hypothetical protein
MGFGEEDDRPDKSRILIEFRHWKGRLGLFAIGVEEGDELSQEARTAMQNIATDTGWPVQLSDKMLEPVEMIGP